MGDSRLSVWGLQCEVAEKKLELGTLSKCSLLQELTARRFCILPNCQLFNVHIFGMSSCNCQDFIC